MSEVPIIALIPAWNEATRIGPVVEATRAHLQVSPRRLYDRANASRLVPGRNEGDNWDFAH